MSENLYDILEISSTADKKQIINAYKTLALQWNPDKNQNRKNLAERKFKRIAEAYTILSDDQKRHEYDFQGNTRNISIYSQQVNPFSLFQSFFNNFPNNNFPNNNFPNNNFPNNNFPNNNFPNNNFPNNNFTNNSFSSSSSSFTNSSYPTSNSYSKSTQVTINNGKRIEKIIENNNGYETITEKIYDMSGNLLNNIS